MKRWSLLAAAALGVGAASCEARPLGLGEHGHDASSAPLSDAGFDATMAPFPVTYGPAMPFPDLSDEPDGGSE